jgi:hypothetical protein
MSFADVLLILAVGSVASALFSGALFAALVYFRGSPFKRSRKKKPSPPRAYRGGQAFSGPPTDGPLRAPKEPLLYTNRPPAPQPVKLIILNGPDRYEVDGVSVPTGDPDA